MSDELLRDEIEHHILTIYELRASIAERDARIAELEARIAELEKEAKSER